MGDFLKFAGVIADAIEHGPLTVRDLTEMVRLNFCDGLSCYPGSDTRSCSSEAFYISLTAKSHKKGNGHLTLGRLMEQLAEHMAGRCKGENHAVTIITDNWVPNEIEIWKETLNQLVAEGVQIEIYLLISGRALTLNSMRGGL